MPYTPTKVSGMKMVEMTVSSFITSFHAVAHVERQTSIRLIASSR
jgi:hypothetical protein